MKVRELKKLLLAATTVVVLGMTTVNVHAEEGFGGYQV